MGLESGGTLVVIDRKDGRIVGSSRFNRYDEQKSEIQIGRTFLARSHWGGVFNREMKRLMLAHAFKFVKRVNFLVGTGNLRSQKAMEKIGGVRTGPILDDSGHESFIYTIDRKDWGPAD